MNKVILVGRITRDPEFRAGQTDNGNVARFSVAVNRRFKNSEGNYDADFPNVVAFGKTADFVYKYFKKGDLIGITGRITTGRYTNKDGVTVYTTDVTAEEVEFVGSKNDNNNTSAPSADDFNSIPNDTLEDEGLPFS